MSKLPDIPLYQSQDSALSQFASSVRQSLMALLGRGADKTDKAVTAADNDAIQKVIDQLKAAKRATGPGDVIIDLGGGLSTSLNISDLAAKLMATSQFKALASATSAVSTSTTPDPQTDPTILQSLKQVMGDLKNLQAEVDEAARVAQQAQTDAAQRQDFASTSFSFPAGDGTRTGTPRSLATTLALVGAEVLKQQQQFGGTVQSNLLARIQTLEAQVDTLNTFLTNQGLVNQFIMQQFAAHGWPSV